MVSKAITGGNLKNLEWENCQVNPVETETHKHPEKKKQTKNLDYFIAFLLTTIIDQIVLLKLRFQDAHFKKLTLFLGQAKD